MAGSRKPGPVGANPEDDELDGGTMFRGPSDHPGPTQADEDSPGRGKSKAQRQAEQDAKLDRKIDEIYRGARDGTLRIGGDYHGDKNHGISPERARQIIAESKNLFLSDGKQGRLIWHDGENVVVTAGRGQGTTPRTAYGPAGIKGQSGAKNLGGSPEDAGEPVTREMIEQGEIPGNVPAAKLIRVLST